MYEDGGNGVEELRKSKEGTKVGARAPLGAVFTETFGLLEEDDGQKEGYDVEDDEDDAISVVKPLPQAFLAEEYASVVDSGPMPSGSPQNPCSYALQHMLDKCPDVSCCHQQAPSDPDGQVKLSVRQPSSNRSRPLV